MEQAPFPFFPELDVLPKADIGACLWKGDDSSGPIVWLEHIKGEWFAGSADGRDCNLACIWEDDAGRPGKIKHLAGEVVGALNPELTEQQKTERIWTFLFAESFGMEITGYLSGSTLDAALSGKIKGRVAEAASQLVDTLAHERGLIMKAAANGKHVSP